MYFSCFFFLLRRPMRNGTAMIKINSAPRTTAFGMIRSSSAFPLMSSSTLSAQPGWLGSVFSQQNCCAPGGKSEIPLYPQHLNTSEMALSCLHSSSYLSGVASFTATFKILYICYQIALVLSDSSMKYNISKAFFQWLITLFYWHLKNFSHICNNAISTS